MSSTGASGFLPAVATDPGNPSAISEQVLAEFDERIVFEKTMEVYELL